MSACRIEVSAQDLLWSKIRIYGGSLRPPGILSVDFRTILALRVGKTWAQDLYVETFWPLLEPEVRHYAHKGGDREELQQEAALALWEAAFRYDPGRHRTRVETFVKNHIHRTVRERYIRSLKHQQREIPIENYAGIKPDDGLDLVETQIDVKNAMLELSRDDQNLLDRVTRLVFGHGMGLEEASRYMADHEGGTVAAWKKKIQRVRRKWRTRITPHHQDGTTGVSFGTHEPIGFSSAAFGFTHGDARDGETRGSRPELEG